MNILAHLFLSADDPALCTGNFMGDFVKNKDLSELPLTIQQGVNLHRGIDEFTDHHSCVKNSKTKLWEKYRHYSAVLVDIFYDHFLAKNFSKFSALNLQDFAQQKYQELEEHQAYLPQQAQLTLFYMKKHNWLYHYQFMEGMARSLEGMARRASFKSKMEEAHHDLKLNYEAFEQDFFLFFPEIMVFCENKIKSFK